MTLVLLRDYFSSSVYRKATFSDEFWRFLKLTGRRAIQLAAVIALVLGVSAYAFGPVSHGLWPFPEDGAGEISSAHGPWPFPEDGAGGNIVAHGPWPFPEDGAGGNIVAHGPRLFSKMAPAATSSRNFRI